MTLVHQPFHDQEEFFSPSRKKLNNHIRCCFCRQKRRIPAAATARQAPGDEMASEAADSGAPDRGSLLDDDITTNEDSSLDTLLQVRSNIPKQREFGCVV